jgi:hypothetical protein
MQAILNKCADMNRAEVLDTHTYIDADLPKCDARKAEGCAVFVRKEASRVVEAKIICRARNQATAKHRCPRLEFVGPGTFA